MHDRHHFDQLNLDMTYESNRSIGLKFSEIRNEVVLVWKWYDRLNYYLTPDGKNYLRGVRDVRRSGSGDDARVHLFDHQIGENINPLASNADLWFGPDYEKWSNDLTKDGKDPLDYVVDRLLEAGGPKLDQLDRQSRLSHSEDLTGLLLSKSGPALPDTKNSIRMAEHRGCGHTCANAPVSARPSRPVLPTRARTPR